MKRVWIILNRASRAVGEDWEAKLVAAFEARGAEVAGTTDFPDDDLPSPKDLDVADVDVAVVAAGDGTINATAHALEDWSGTLLVLPGGTMNLLAKALHGDALPEAIVAAVTSPPAAHPLPTVVSGDHRAVVGIIVGPAARWVHAREAVRHGRWHRLLRAIRLASLRTLSQSVRVREGARRSKGYRAIFAHPNGDSLAIIRVRAAGWADGVRLGFTYVTGTWERARGIETNNVAEVRLASERPVFALFDGEPVYLPPDAKLRAGKTRLKFVTTKGSNA